jgi:hypothetical protein
MSAVMMTLINAPKIRVPEKVAGVQGHLVQTVAVAPPAMRETAAVMTANATIVNVTTVSVMISNATTLTATLPRGVPFPARRAMSRRPLSITAAWPVKR